MTEPTRPIDQTLHVNELPPISAEQIETMSEQEAMEWIEQATNFYAEESRNDLIKRLIRARTLAYWWRTRNDAATRETRGTQAEDYWKCDTCSETVAYEEMDKHMYQKHEKPCSYTRVKVISDAAARVSQPVAPPPPVMSISSEKLAGIAQSPGCEPVAPRASTPNRDLTKEDLAQALFVYERASETQWKDVDAPIKRRYLGLAEEVIHALKRRAAAPAGTQPAQERE